MTSVTSQAKHFYEFGIFRLSPEEHRLYRNAEPVPLPPKEFDLLLLLVRNSGQLMGRDNLLTALWPDTIVEEANLNVHISALRKVLAEGSGEQHYIETLPRLGYRFTAPVTEISAPEVTTTTAIPEAETPNQPANGSETLTGRGAESIQTPATPTDFYSRHRWAAVILPLWLLAIGLIGVLSLMFFRSFRTTPQNDRPESSVNVVPLTTFAGREIQPALSPDGTHIAFVWGGEKGDNQDIYVRLVDGGNSVRLTTQEGDDVNPCWSPDGRSIAYYRSTPQGDAIFIMTSLGGGERKLTTAFSNRFGFGSHTWLSWSPDGKWLVLSDKGSSEEPFSLFLVSPQTGERRRVTSPPGTIIGDCSPAFSPDGKELAFVRVISAVVGEVYIVSTQGGAEKRLTFDGAGISNLAWGPRGSEIIFSSRFGGKNRLLRVPVSGGKPEWLAAAGNDSQYPTFSSQGNRLAWMQNTDNTDVLRVSLKNGNQAGQPPAPLIASTANEVSPRYSPDGSKIVFVSNRSGSDEIWVCASNGEDSIRLTSFRGPLAGSPSWSPDGKQIVFDCRPEGNADIFVISSDGGQPRRFTMDSAEDIVPSWSHDGRWIYFTSNRSGRLQIWKQLVDRGEAIQMTKSGGFEPVEGLDGQWLYFTKDRGSSAIWRMPVAGGDETLVFDSSQKDYSRFWTAGIDGLYFAVAAQPAKTVMNFLVFATGAVRPVAEIDGRLPSSVSGLSISPDKRSMLVPVISQRGSDLMMIEDFR